MKLLLAILLIILWPTIIFADNTTNFNSKNNELNIPIYYPPKSEHQKTDWTFGYSPQKGIIQYEFKGVWRYATKEIKSRFKRVYRAQLLDYWNSSNDNQFTWHNYLDELNELESNDKWWQRSWLDSRPETKGGSPNYRIVLFGQEGDWISIGPIVLTHDLRLRIEGTNVSFDSDQPLKDLENRYIQNSKTGKSDTVNVETLKDEPWLDNKYWKVKIKPSINLGRELSTIIRTASMKLEIQLFKQNGLHFGNFECVAQYDFNKKDYQAAAFFSLHTW